MPCGQFLAKDLARHGMVSQRTAADYGLSGRPRYHFRPVGCRRYSRCDTPIEAAEGTQLAPANSPAADRARRSRCLSPERDPSALVDHQPRGNMKVLSVDWQPWSYGGRPWGPDDGCSGGSERVSVRIYNVPSHERSRIERAILSTPLLELVAWLSAAANAPEGCRIMLHGRSWRMVARRASR